VGLAVPVVAPLGLEMVFVVAMVLLAVLVVEAAGGAQAPSLQVVAATEEMAMSVSSASNDDTWLIVYDNVVSNVVVWDGMSDWVAPEGAALVKASGPAGVGWRFVNGVWVRPPDPDVEADS